MSAYKRKKLNPENVPPNLRDLIPLAESWAIGDDIERELEIDNMTIEQCQEIVDRFAPFEDEIDEWLGGQEAQGPTYSEEYIAFTDLRELVDGARWRLDNQ